MSQKGFVHNVFTQFVETLPPTTHGGKEIQTEGIITSFNEFISLLQDASDIYNKTFNIADDKQLRILEEFPGELLHRINSDSFEGIIDEKTLTNIRVVTYTTSEKPATISSHRVDEDGVKNIKDRLIDIIPDPEYTGYSIARTGKDIEAVVTFKVWGLSLLDIRSRAKQLRDMIKLNTWFLKHKGLRDIVWLGSSEWEEWEGKKIIKSKSEKFMVRYTELTQTKEKNLEQIVIQMGIDGSPQAGTAGDFFTPA